MKKWITILTVILLAASVQASNELRIFYDDSATPKLYAIVRDAGTPANVWDVAGGAWDATFTAGEIANYDIQLTNQPADSDYWVADFPTGITTAGTYDVAFYVDGNGDTTPATTDELIGSTTITWTGNAEVEWMDLWEEILKGCGTNR
jgi:hypothetical protein